MHFAVGSNSSETDLLSDMDEMMRGMQSTAYHVITMIDRVEGHSEDSTTLGENFTDTRLYQFGTNTYKRLDGKGFFPEINTSSNIDLNMADASVLKRFIQYCKKYFPADHYLLILRSHGNGVGMCPDAESGSSDRLYPGEIADVLTADESVDILGLDVCSMAGLENLYEWRPRSNGFSADYVIASAPLSGAWAYDHILGRLQDDISLGTGLDENHFGHGNEVHLNPALMTPFEFSNLMIEEIYDNQRWASWGLFDNSKITTVKNEVDKLALLLVNEPNDSIISIMQNSLGYHHNTSQNIEVAQLTFPYLDAYHFWHQLSTHEQLKVTTRAAAMRVCQAIDELVVHSYYGRGFLPETAHFSEGKSGAYQVIPLGNKIFSRSGRSFWAHTTWFHPGDQTATENAYGMYDWCMDGAVPGNQQIDNFFEYLDYLFDESNTHTGGVNNYQW